MGKLVDWCFRSRATGRITIGQWPNLPLIVFAAAWAAGRVFHPDGTAGSLVRLVAVVSLAAWALDELVRGVNPWRRFLGAAVLASQAVALLA